MTTEQSALWQRIEAFEFTRPDAVVTFSDKLIRQTGWTQAAAAEAIDAYRRFLFLAAAAGHPVSPSPVADEVWHLHLLYTRNYWDELCHRILGFHLHHEPAIGTAGDREKLNDWYAKTLASYERFFGQPPLHIWSQHPRETIFRRIDPANTVTLSRPLWNALLASVVGLFLLVILCIIWLAVRSQGGHY